MKYNGKKLSGPNVAELILPRGSDEVIVIKAQAVLDYSEFDKVCPQPEPPIKILRGGGRSPDFDNPSFIQDMGHWGNRKTSWMVLQSLKATEGLEWEIVELADPNTWGKWTIELQEAGFSEIERQRILNLVMDANALSEKKLEEAREGFLSGRLRLLHTEKSSSPMEDQKNTPSGELANGRVFVPQV
jgi:hypothetical protein